MTKLEIYNAVIDLYKKTGQGLSGFVLTKGDVREKVDQLVEDGLLKIVHQSYRHLPDDDWICLTKGYCVEDDYGHESERGNTLAFMRYYLDIPQGLGITKKQLEETPEFMTKYHLWLNTNREKIEEGFNIENMPEGSLPEREITLTEEESSYVKNLNLYKKNPTVSECISLLREKDKLYRESIQCYRRMLDIMNTKSDHYAQKIKDTQKDMQSDIDELKLREGIEKFLGSIDGKKLIQEVI
jgi:hypothetical protein